MPAKSSCSQPPRKVLIVPKEGCMTPTLLEKRGLFKSIWVDTMTPRLLLFIKMGLKLQAKQSKAKQSKANNNNNKNRNKGPNLQLLKLRVGIFAFYSKQEHLTFCIVRSHGPNQIITISYFQIPQTFLEQSQQTPPLHHLHITFSCWFCRVQEEEEEEEEEHSSFPYHHQPHFQPGFRV